MIYYLLLVIILASRPLYRAMHSTSKRIIVTSCLCAILIIIAALRSPSVGVDTNQFYNTYQSIGTKGIDSRLFARYEPLFVLLCAALNLISNNAQLLLIVTSILIVAPVGYFVYRWSKEPVLSLFFYVTLNFYFVGLNMMRQAIAMSMVLLAMLCFERGRRVHFLLVAAVAILFHYSAVVAVAAIMLTKIGYSNRVAAVYCALAVLAAVLFGTALDVATQIVGHELYDPEFLKPNYFGAVLIALFTLLIWVICLIGFNYVKSYKTYSTSSNQGLGNVEENHVLSFVLHTTSLWLIFNCCAIQVEAASRIAYYFGLTAIVSLPNCVCLLPDIWRKRCLAALILLCVAYFSIVLLFRPGWFGVIPYQFFLIG